MISVSEESSTIFVVIVTLKTKARRAMYVIINPRDCVKDKRLIEDVGNQPQQELVENRATGKNFKLQKILNWS